MPSSCRPSAAARQASEMHARLTSERPCPSSAWAFSNCSTSPQLKLASDRSFSGCLHWIHLLYEPRPVNYGVHQLLDAVDCHDRVVGSVRRAGVFPRRANFRAAHLFLFNRQSERLLQRLALSRSRHPGCWGSSVAAYVNAGESYRQAVERRAQQDLGVQVEGLQLRGKTSMAEEGSTKFVTLFTGQWDGPLIVDSSHIAQVRFLPVEKLVAVRRAEPWTFTPTFAQLLDLYLNHGCAK